MVNEYGLIVECAYSKLEEELNNEYVATPDQKEKEKFMLKAFTEFLNNIKG
jgi:hypothetical protein